MKMAWLIGLSAITSAITAGCGEERECVSRQGTYCHEGVTYWYDSCGDLEEVLERCQHGCSGDHSVCMEEPLSCRIDSLVDSQLVNGLTQVVIVLNGPINRVALVAGAETMAEADVETGLPAVRLDWSTSDLPDGPVSLIAQARAEDGRLALSDPIRVQVDNTLPAASFGEGLARLETLSGTTTIPLSVQEANLASLRVTCAGQELFASTEVVDQFAWDTALVPDGIRTLSLEVTDRVGQSIVVESPPVVLVNSGQVAEMTYDPAAELVIPENWQSVDLHVRASTASLPGVKRIISWVTWDASRSWEIEYAVGQGLCPHQGIRYLAAQSSSGEIVIDLAREDLDPEIVARLPEADQDSQVFPHNSDPRTFGAFFGHLAVMDPAEHINQVLPVEIHYVFLFAD